MKTLRLELPDGLHEKLCEMAAREQKTVEEFTAVKLVEWVIAAEELSFIGRRALRADHDAFERIMAKVPDVPAMPGDELPEGYERIRPKRDTMDAGGGD